MKKLIQSVLFPPSWFRWIFGILSLLAVAGVLGFRLQDLFIVYASYLASALGLYYLITVTVIPLVKCCKAWLMRSKYIRRYYEDITFSARVRLYLGLVVNVLYAVFKLVTGLIYRSEWLIAIAAYYGVLILLKSLLAAQDLRILRQNENADRLSAWRTYRRTGWLMLLLDVGLSGIVVQVVTRNESYSYPGMVIFAMAAYSFYRIVIAVIRLMKDRKNRDPLFSAAKTIDLSFAVTSMFTLQTAMFASFAPDLDVRIPNIISGTAVALIITVLAVAMIIRASIKMNSMSDIRS